MKKHLASIVFLLLGACVLWAQQAAPRDTASLELNGKKVSIEYGRPALKGRTFESLMGSLPADRMWRTGSEQVTTLTTETDLLVGGKKVPAGKYSLYLHVAEEGPYSLAVNKVLGQPLGDIWSAAPPAYAKEPWPHFNYQKEIGDQEVARVPLQESHNSSSVDLFTITLKSDYGASQLTLSWGDQSWSTKLEPAKKKAEGSHGH